MKKAFKRTILTATLLLILLVAAFFTLRYLYPKKYSEQVEQYSTQYGVDADLVYAVIKCESNFDTKALSHANAFGLMQITKETYEWAAKREKDDSYVYKSLFDPDTNIRYGCAIYSIFENEFGDVPTTLAAYNAGRGRVNTWLSNSAYSSDGKTLDVIPFVETENYVKKVLRTQKIYKLIY